MSKTCVIPKALSERALYGGQTDQPLQPLNALACGEFGSATAVRV
jgi:hypothetical protein